MIFYDFEVFKYDWLVCYLDTNTREVKTIVNSKSELEKFYQKHCREIWVGYNSRQYDVWIAKAILADFNPYDMNDWLINKDRKGFEFSRLLNNFPIINYDSIVGFRGLKELEAFMGHDIRETSVPFNLDRRLTDAEIAETIEYCTHDVMETFHVFVENKKEFESHMGLIKEYNLPLHNVSKTKAQISAIILGANKVNRRDEFDIRFPDTLDLGKYEYIKDFYINWAKNSKNYKEMSLKTEICGVPHTFGIGGLHGSRDKYYGTGHFILADVASYYPALNIEYDMLSRNVSNKSRYKQIRDERLEMKAKGDPRQEPRKIVLNSTFGACKDVYNQLYDPQQANNICIAGQLLLTDLLDKLEGKCELIQSNTDGILIKLYRSEDRERIVGICNEWSKRTRMDLEFEDYKTVIQKDVNNYMFIPDGALYDEKGKELFARKGAYVKRLSLLDNDLPIVNRAIVNYFTANIPVEKTINASNKLIDFQKISKVGRVYEHCKHNNVIMTEKVYRTFASRDKSDGTLLKKHESKDTYDKVASVPDNAFIDNEDITDKSIPDKLDKQWYINLSKTRIKDFKG